MDPAEIDEELAKSLRRARRKPQYFALIARGPNCRKLFVSRRRLPDPAVRAAKKECGGLVVYRGMCFGDGAAYMVFQVSGKEPSIVVMKFRRFIRERTGLNLMPRFEVLGDDAESDGEE